MAPEAPPARTPAPAAGFLYPGHSAEDDYPRLEQLLAAAGADVRLPVVRTDIGTDAHRPDALHEMGAPERLAAALPAVHAQGAQAVVWACTSGSFVRGWDGAHQQVQQLAAAAGLPASSTSFAFVHALRALGATRVAVAATYPADIGKYFADFLAEAGCTVLTVRSSGILTAAEVGTWDTARVLDLARAGDHPDAQAVLLPDTALHTVAALPALEAALGKPVLTANQVTAWEGLRLLDRRTPVPRLGALFA